MSDNQMKTSIRYLPLILLLTLGSLWALSPVFTKFLALEGISPIGAIFWQTLIAGIGLYIICRFRGVNIVYDIIHLRYFAVMGAVGIALPNSNMVFVLGQLCIAWVPLRVRSRAFRHIGDVARDRDSHNRTNRVAELDLAIRAHTLLSVVRKNPPSPRAISK